MAKNPNRNGSKDKGTRGETGVVRTLRSLGFGDAKKANPEDGHDLGDIRSYRVVWQIKAGAQAHHASEAKIAEWMADTEKQTVAAGGDYGILVTARAGFSPGRAQFWWAWLSTLDVITLMTPSGEQGITIPRVPSMEVADYPIRYPLHLVAALLEARGYAKEATD